MTHSDASNNSWGRVRRNRVERFTMFRARFHPHADASVLGIYYDFRSCKLTHLAAAVDVDDRSPKARDDVLSQGDVEISSGDKLKDRARVAIVIEIDGRARCTFAREHIRVQADE